MSPGANTLVRTTSRKYNFGIDQKTKPLALGICETDNGPKTDSGKLFKLDYKKLADRLTSFVDWPNNSLSKETLAKAGFYYTKQEDVVRCPFCEIEGYQWVAGDDPMEDHRRWSPFCPFVQQNTEHNNTTDSTQRSQDTCGLYNVPTVQIFPNSVPEDNRSPLNLEKFGIPKHKGPVYPDKVTYESRLETYSVWPKSIKQRPPQLSDAGFYYVGVGDRTQCFHCGGGLQDWEADDSPWEQHALWFPKCNYLLTKKGHQFVKEVQTKNEPQGSASTSSSIETKEKEGVKVEEVLSASASTSSSTTEKEEEKKVTDETLCKICYTNKVEVFFLPCTHIVACVECAAALKSCPVCRTPIEAAIRAILS